jgi:hypothetical protein
MAVNFNLRGIYYGFRRESTKKYGRLYSQLRDICAGYKIALQDDDRQILTGIAIEFVGVGGNRR